MSVTLRIQASSLSSSERVFSVWLTGADLKEKLVSITGIPVGAQALTLDGQPLADDQTIQNAQDGSVLTVRSTDPTVTSSLAAFQDDDSVEKFELSPEEYAKRSDTVRAFKERHRLGRFAPQSETTTTPAAEPAIDLPPIGARCTTSFATGTWIGCELDEPLGNSDGEVKGQRYFQTAPKHAAMIKPDLIRWGDQYSALDLDDEMEI